MTKFALSTGAPTCARFLGGFARLSARHHRGDSCRGIACHHGFMSRLPSSHPLLLQVSFRRSDERMTVLKESVVELDNIRLDLANECVCIA